MYFNENGQIQLTIFFSGMKNTEKDKFIRLAEKQGLKVRKSVSKDLDYFCCGDQVGAVSLKKAKRNKVEILNEKQFLSAIASGKFNNDLLGRKSIIAKEEAKELLEEARLDYLEQQEEEEQERLAEIEDAKEDRLCWFEDYYETINDYREHYDCKKISKKLFKQVVADFEAAGMSLEEIENHEEEFFDKCFQIKPDLLKQSSKAKADSSGCVILFLFVICVIIGISYI